MEAQDYQAAVKKIQATKPKENYLLCSVSWDVNLVFPYKAGMVFMEAMGQAEKLVEEYNKPPGIQPIDRDKIQFRVLSAKEYEQIRIAQVLKVPLDTVREYETTNA